MSPRANNKLMIAWMAIYAGMLDIRGGWKLVISDAAIAQLVQRDDVIIRAAIVAHSKRRTRFTLRRPRLFGTKLAQWILLGELSMERYGLP